MCTGCRHDASGSHGCMICRSHGKDTAGRKHGAQGAAAICDRPAPHLAAKPLGLQQRRVHAGAVAGGCHDCDAAVRCQSVYEGNHGLDPLQLLLQTQMCMDLGMRKGACIWVGHLEACQSAWFPTRTAALRSNFRASPCHSHGEGHRAHRGGALLLCGSDCVHVVNEQDRWRVGLCAIERVLERFSCVAADSGSVHNLRPSCRSMKAHSRPDLSTAKR